MRVCLAVLCILLLQSGALGFAILPGDSFNHLEITEMAILNVTVNVCRNLALAVGTVFILPPRPFTAESVAVACSSPGSSKGFRRAIKYISWRNAAVDLEHALDASYHFDDEHFTQGRKIITDGISTVKASNRRDNFEAARKILGEIFHPLQDFYSHSNWVEMGNKLPNSNLIQSTTSIGNIADVGRATCRSCDGDDCRNNILEDVLQEKVLTSGYFNLFVSTKPTGKCSHGGGVDRTSVIAPTGGINKDTTSASHGYLHQEAAGLAVDATAELLEDIRGAAGDTDFLQMVGISKGSNKALCFVIDNTSSMGDDIEAVKEVTSLLVSSLVGTEDEPSVYILVPFNDPGVGPLIRTTDPKVFKDQIHALSVAGGGDSPELSLSGLQLALTAAPFGSEIFLFTDAAAKDSYLRNTVLALIERTNTVVNFMLTAVLGHGRRRRSVQDQQSIRMTRSDVQLYRDLAQASGGKAIEVSKSELSQATSIIIESSSSSLVNILQVARSPGKAESFSFSVDESVTKLVVYITGRSLNFTLISPSGASQSSRDETGSLGTILSVGNFWNVRLNKQEGLWEVRMVSTEPYTLKVIGQSAIDFLFDFVELSQGPNEGLHILETRPRAGVKGSLLITLTGSDSAAVTEVALVEAPGAGELIGSVTPQGGGDFLIDFESIPSVAFVVRVMGQDGSRAFQRQSHTNLRASNLTIIADSDSILVPGTPLSVPFTVMADHTGGNFTIRAINDRSFDSSFPTNLLLERGGSANGTLTLVVPLNTLSGSDVTLTIEAEAPGGTDTNYVVLRLSILNTVTDFNQPVCQLLSRQANCSGDCSFSMWELFINVTDGIDGTGVDHVSLRQGNGTLNTSMSFGIINVTLASYVASCCAPDVELLVVDKVGNVGSCVYSALSTATKATMSSCLCLSMAISLILKLGLLTN